MPDQNTMGNVRNRPLRMPWATPYVVHAPANRFIALDAKRKPVRRWLGPIRSHHQLKTPWFKHDKSISPQTPSGLISDNLVTDLPKAFCSSTICKKPKCIYGNRARPRKEDKEGLLKEANDLKSHSSAVRRATKVHEICSFNLSFARFAISSSGLEVGFNGQLSSFPLASAVSFRTSTLWVTWCRGMLHKVWILPSGRERRTSRNTSAIASEAISPEDFFRTMKACSILLPAGSGRTATSSIDWSCCSLFSTESKSTHWPRCFMVMSARPRNSSVPSGHRCTKSRVRK